MTQHQNVVEFVVMGEPKPWTVYTKQGRATPAFDAMVTWQDFIGIEAKKAMKGKAAFTGPIYLKVLFCRGFPKWAPKSSNIREKWAENHILMKPDTTNYLKACEDALNNIVYLDDAQVIKPSSEKEYGAFPHTQILVQAPKG